MKRQTTPLLWTHTGTMGRRGKGGDKKGDGDIKEEEVLQAILLADSFSQAFRPVSLEIPKVRAASACGHNGGPLCANLWKPYCISQSRQPQAG